MAQLRGGDVIVANVGAGASDVVVGKDINILRIGTLVIPALPAVIALIATLIGSGVGLWLYLVPAKMTPDYFNIAVAEFGVVDAQGRTRATADSKKISRTLFTTIQGELQQLTEDYRARVWHDSLNLLQKRTTIGLIPGATPAERWAAACKRATQLGADIIVYGVLEPRGGNQALLRLELCARNSSRERDLGNLDELQRADRLGGPLPVDLPLSDVQASVNPPLRVRTTLVARLVVGLRYELASNPNFQFSLNKALGVFTGTLQFLEQEEGTATADNGGDVVHYFIGREHFLLFQDAATPKEDRPAHLETARAEFERATGLNPEYARAFSALGAVYLQRAQQVAPEQRQGSSDITKAIEAFQSAISSADAAGDPSAEAEARLNLALTYRLQAEALLFPPADVPRAEATLQLADQQAGAGEALIEPAQNRLRGVAALARAFAAHDRAQIRSRAGDKAAARGFFQQAIGYYDQCIAAGQADPGDQFLKRQIVDVTCVPRRQSAAAAIQRIQP